MGRGGESRTSGMAPTTANFGGPGHKNFSILLLKQTVQLLLLNDMR